MSNQDRATTEQAEAGAMLPNLPESFGDHCVTDSVRTMCEPGYTADQMRAYAQAAIDALTRKGGEDTARLAMLVDNQYMTQKLRDTGQWVLLDGQGYLVVDGHYDTARAAIDAAIAAAPRDGG